MNRPQQRVLQLAGGINFRDVGGYRTRDGRELRWGKIYRTGVLSYFTPDDHYALYALQVRTICDLRRGDERGREPTRWPDAATRILSFDDGAAPPTIRQEATRHPDTGAGMHTAMMGLYRSLPTWLGPRIRGMFEHIAKNDVPMVVHCSAGKDRTGIAIALLLAALDVPRETIVADYLLTNEAGDFEQFIAQRQQAQLGLATSNHPLLALNPEVRRVLFSAHTDFLDSAFSQIDTEHGGIDGFLDKQGVDNAVRQRVREQLLVGN